MTHTPTNLGICPVGALMWWQALWSHCGPKWSGSMYNKSIVHICSCFREKQLCVINVPTLNFLSAFNPWKQKASCFVYKIYPVLVFVFLMNKPNTIHKRFKVILGKNTIMIQNWTFLLKTAWKCNYPLLPQSPIVLPYFYYFLFSKNSNF